VIPALLKTVFNRLQAGGVAVVAVIDAFLHAFADVVSFDRPHRSLLPVDHGEYTLAPLIFGGGGSACVKKMYQTPPMGGIVGSIAGGKR
jgi:hypothetical protein